MSEFLRFTVSNQTIKRIDTFEPVARSVDYLYAHFDFLTREWDNSIKTAIFTSDNTSYEMILDENGNCKVPWESLQIDSASYIRVSVFGTGESLVTVNTASVFVRKSGYSDDLESSQDPTPGVYAQILSMVQETKDLVTEKAEEIEAYVDEKVANIDGGLFTDWT